MKICLLCLLTSAWFVRSSCAIAPATSLPPKPGKASPTNIASTILLGGIGGAYFLAEPGELVVQVEKRDRNRRAGRTDLRAILAGPDRSVVQEVTIPDDGQPKGSGLGPVQRCLLSTKVPAKGVYVLNITVSQDRYGDEVVWGFQANCKKFLIETARGHRDQRHQEPIVLANPQVPANVCFWPRNDAFGIEVSGMPKGSTPVIVYDTHGTPVARLHGGTEGQALHHFPATASRQAAPWRLHFPAAQATVNIDGLTRWDTGDLHPDMACWTTDPQSWFPFLDNRWILTPYRRTVCGQPGNTNEVTFQLHNKSAREKNIQLTLEFPQEVSQLGAPASLAIYAELSVNRVVLGPKQTKNMTVKCRMPPHGQTRLAYIRATPLDDSGFSTYSTLSMKSGLPSAARPLAMPILLKPYEHENEQYGYQADYPVDNQAYFDLKNNPFIRTSSGITTWRNGSWDTSLLSSAIQTRIPRFEGNAFGLPSTKIAFDSDNDLYALAMAGRKAVLLHSADGGKALAAYVIPGHEDRPRSFDFEQFSGQNVPPDPPPILRYSQTSRDEKLIWRRLHTLELFLPRKQGGHISLGEPVMFSDKCIGSSGHSGIPSSIVSRGSKVHVVWGEATDPTEKIEGVPTFVATYDRIAGTLGRPALVAYGPPANDVHNSPSIAMDKAGYLHVLAGTHGRPFPYTQSLEPNEAATGWTKAIPAGDNLGQTYVGLVCGPDDTLHSVFRMWRSGVEPFPSSSHATLAYQRKRPGQPWEPPRVLVVAPFSEYSVFYHRLTVDRWGRLFLSYDYWSTFWFYRNDHFGRRRSVLMSPDGGETWKLAESSDLVPRP